jgi:hypothetical protein
MLRNPPGATRDMARKDRSRELIGRKALFTACPRIARSRRLTGRKVVERFAQACHEGRKIQSRIADAAQRVGRIGF